jgi:hypothetical protein
MHREWASALEQNLRFFAAASLHISIFAVRHKNYITQSFLLLARTAGLSIATSFMADFILLLTLPISLGAPQMPAGSLACLQCHQNEQESAAYSSTIRYELSQSLNISPLLLIFFRR